MIDFEAFRNALRDALHHLHDPDYAPPSALCEVIGCTAEDAAGPAQGRVAAAIHDLRPASGTPADSRSWLHFESIDKRFVQGLTQEETAARLHMSVRNVQRVQAEAIHVLARRMWQRGPNHPVPGSVSVQAAQALDWRAQADLELARLRQESPNAQADVCEVIQQVIALESALSSLRGIHVSVGHVQEQLVAAVHPSILRQTLITAIGGLVPFVIATGIYIYASLADGQVGITLRGPIGSREVPEEQAIREAILLPRAATVSVYTRNDSVFLQISLPAVGERTVLVVEDNNDMVYFYRRATAGTSYRIVHVLEPEAIFDVAGHTPADAIVLDVMLPTVDGWQLLTHLRERDATRSIPVVVCTVVKEESLALALGAAAFLAKPVPPQEFVRALDRVVRPESAATSTPQGYSAAAS